MHIQPATPFIDQFHDRSPSSDAFLGLLSIGPRGTACSRISPACFSQAEPTRATNGGAFQFPNQSPLQAQRHQREKRSCGVGTILIHSNSFSSLVVRFSACRSPLSFHWLPGEQYTPSRCLTYVMNK